MRYLRKFSEGFYEDELVYSLAYFNDKYGDPIIETQKYSNSEVITLTWILDLSTSEDVSNSLEKLQGKLQELANDMDHIITAKDRYKDYNFYPSIIRGISQINKLKLKIIPKGINIVEPEEENIIGK